MTTARIYKPAKTAMQSGQARTKQWLLEFDRVEPREIEPLMGWTSSGDTRQQVQLWFELEGGGDRLRDPRGHRLPGRGARGAEAPHDLVCRQFQVQPRRPVDALSGA